MPTLRPRERRLLVVAGLLAVATLGHAYVVTPLAERHRQLQELIAARQDLVARQQRLLTRQERYAREREELQTEIAQRRARLLPGDKAPLAASELQKLLKGTAQDTGVEVRSERILPTTERGGYLEVPIEVTLSGPVRAIVSLVYRLEAAPVLLTLSDLKLRVVSVATPRELSATLSLTGYIAASATDGVRSAPAEAGRRPGT